MMFRPEMATAMASFFLRKDPNGTLNDLRLMKLLYISDREMILRSQHPISGAKYVSMKNGPVLSEVFDLYKGNRTDEVWVDHIEFIPKSDTESNQLRLRKEFDSDEYLSPNAIKLLEEIWNTYKDCDKWDLVEQTHRLPEWDESVINSSPYSRPIRLESILEQDATLNEEERKAIAANIRYHFSLGNRK